MEWVYVIYEEREDSRLCGIRGIWGNRENAIEQMKSLINCNGLYSEFSLIDFENGCSESDPMYSEDSYSNYYLKTMVKQ